MKRKILITSIITFAISLIIIAINLIFLETTFYLKTNLMVCGLSIISMIIFSTNKKKIVIDIVETISHLF